MERKVVNTLDGSQFRGVMRRRGNIGGVVPSQSCIRWPPYACAPDACNHLHRGDHRRGRRPSRDASHRIELGATGLTARQLLSDGLGTFDGWVGG